MAYGFELLNSNGEILLDDTSFPLVLQTSGSVTTTAGADGTISFSDLGELPVIFIQSPSGGVWVALNALTSSQAKFTAFDGSSTASATLAKVSATINYRVYNRSNIVPPSTPPVGQAVYGMQVLSASGAVTFDSRLVYARVNTVMSLATPAPTNIDTTLYTVSSALPAGATSSAWFSLGGFGGAGRQQTSTGIPPGSFLYGHASRIFGTNMQVAYVYIAPTSGGYTTWQPGRSIFITNS
jgi:hypothetical protein